MNTGVHVSLSFLVCRLFDGRHSDQSAMILHRVLDLHFSDNEMGIPDHLTCLLRNLCAGQEATVRTGHGTTDTEQQIGSK